MTRGGVPYIERMRRSAGRGYGRAAAVAGLSCALVAGAAAPALAWPHHATNHRRPPAHQPPQHTKPTPKPEPKPKPKPTETPEHALIHWLNVTRAQHGLAALASSADLTAVAHRHTAAMTARDKVFHDPTLGTEVHDWVSLGEDVGSAASLADLEHAFLRTPADRANLLGAGFRQVGVGAKLRDGLLYVTVIERRPAA